MKKPVFILFLLIISFSVSAQPPKTTTRQPVKVQTVQPPFKTINDSASYAVGMSMASFCKQQGIVRINTGLSIKAIADVMEDKSPLLGEMVCNDIINTMLIRGKLTGKQSLASVKPDTIIKTFNDSISYAIGFNHASFFKQQGITSLNIVFVIASIKDVLGNKPLRFNDRTATRIMNRLITQLQEEKVKPTIDAGNSFLESNKRRPEVKVTASGLQYEVIAMGNGIKPAKSDTFVCHYSGTLIDGTKFDASYDRNEPLILPVTSVIKGWTEGLQLMPVGSKYKFYIPYTLAYGAFDNGAIPGGAALIFEVELLDVKKAKVAKPIKPRG